MKSIIPPVWFESAKLSEYWRGDMTICIAAFCEWGRSLVLCTDHMLTVEDLSADDMVLKIRGIHSDWAVMYSPDDITHVKPILQRVRLGIPDRKVPASLDEVRTKIERAYTEEFQGEQDKSFLAWYRMDVAEFKREGRNFFGESLFGQYCQRLEQTTLKCELLLAGFDEKRLGHLFTVTDPGKVMLFDDVGFWAIGSGQRNALSSLFSCSFNIRKSLHEGIYHVCAAKFMSEGAQGVGNETAGLLCRRNDDYTKIEIKEITQEFITEIRRIWNDEGKPRLPKSTVGIVDSAVRSGKTVFLG